MTKIIGSKRMPAGRRLRHRAVELRDPERYARYQAEFMPVLLKYNSVPLVADHHPQLLQGSLTLDKVILMAFQDKDSATRWLTSPEYQAISRDREAATAGTGLLLRGVDPLPAIGK